MAETNSSLNDSHREAAAGSLDGRLPDGQRMPGPEELFELRQQGRSAELLPRLRAVAELSELAPAERLALHEILIEVLRDLGRWGELRGAVAAYGAILQSCPSECHRKRLESHREMLAEPGSSSIASDPEFRAVGVSRGAVLSYLDLCRQGRADSCLVLQRGCSGQLRELAEYRAPCSPKLAQRMSSTKSVMGLVAQLLVSRGLLDLDQGVGDIMPHWTEWSTGAKAAVTVRHLLTHTSGLPGNAWFEEQATKQQFGGFTELTAGARSLDLVRQPAGSCYDYSNPGTHLLVPIFEEAVNRGCSAGAADRISLQDFIRTELFAPLKIRNWRWHSTAGQISGHQGLALSDRDFAKLGLLLLQNGSCAPQLMADSGEQAELLSGGSERRAELIEELVRPAPASPPSGCLSGRAGQLWWSSPYGVHTSGYLNNDLYLLPQVPSDCSGPALIVVRSQSRPPADPLYEQGLREFAECVWCAPPPRTGTNGQ